MGTACRCSAGSAAPSEGGVSRGRRGESHAFEEEIEHDSEVKVFVCIIKKANDPLKECQKGIDEDCGRIIFMCLGNKNQRETFYET